MSDLITDAMVEAAAEAFANHEFRINGPEMTPYCTCGQSATFRYDVGWYDQHVARLPLEVVAPLIAAKALEVARGPYRCCPHCTDDLIHDVEKDDHTVPCQLCQNDEINRAAAKAWDEGYAEGGRGRMWESTNPYQTRADAIERGES